MPVHFGQRGVHRLGRPVKKNCNVIRLASSPQRHQIGMAPTSECDDRLTEVFPREEISERFANTFDTLQLILGRLYRSSP